MAPLSMKQFQIKKKGARNTKIKTEGQTEWK